MTLDISALLHDPMLLLTDGFLVSLIPLFTYGIKVFIKPNKIEASVIARLFVTLMIILLKVGRKWASSNKLHMDDIHADLRVLKSNLKSDNIDGIG